MTLTVLRYYNYQTSTTLEKEQFLETPTRNLPYPSAKEGPSKDFLTSIIKKSDIDKLHINTVNFVAVNVSL